MLHYVSPTLAARVAVVGYSDNVEVNGVHASINGHCAVLKTLTVECRGSVSLCGGEDNCHCFSLFALDACRYWRQRYHATAQRQTVG